MKILVAGASGLIGGEVARLLKERRHYVRTLSRDPGRAAKLKAVADDVRLVAEAIMSAITASTSSEIDIGDPEVLTRRQIAELAFMALGKKPRLLASPVWPMRIVAGLYGIVNRRMGEFLRFIILASTNACVAPAIGSRRLRPYFEQEAQKTQ
ncbi:MAG TPA: NmrA family NAD(P)-binding protein [Blastocatellia bacterium]|nr:NmrA family NAD(P)-binding protein [Blastocatellia bacterium]